MTKKWLVLLKNIPNSRLECTNHTPFQTKMVEVDTLFQTKTAKNPYLWRGPYLTACHALRSRAGLQGFRSGKGYQIFDQV